MTNYDKLNEMILGLDLGIRFCGVANNKSEIVSASTQKNRSRLLNDDEVKMSIHYTLERWEKTSNLSHKIGNEKSAIIAYDKVVLISIPLNEKELLLISVEPDADYFKITNKTRELLKDFKE